MKNTPNAIHYLTETKEDEACTYCGWADKAEDSDFCSDDCRKGAREDHRAVTAVCDPYENEIWAS